MSKIIKIAKAIIAWLLAIFYALAAIVYLPGGGSSTLCGIIATLFVIIILPIPVWQKLLHRFLKGKIKVIIAVVLAILTFTLYPRQNISTDSTISKNDDTSAQTNPHDCSTSEDEALSSTESPYYPTVDDTIHSEVDTSHIAVRYETNYIDGNRLHLTVFMQNNSSESFTGNVHVAFYSADGKDFLGSDLIIVDQLSPGQQSWADVIVDIYYGTPQMYVDFTEVQFFPITEHNSVIDVEATEKTKNSFRLNFEGVSWYQDITDITVYTEGICVVTICQEPKENGQFYAFAIWNCGYDFGINAVHVINPDGVILCVFDDSLD